MGWKRGERGQKGDARNIGVVGTPSESERGLGGVQLLGDGGQLSHLLEFGFTLGRLKAGGSILEEVLVRGESRIGWDAVVVFTRQDTELVVAWAKALVNRAPVRMTSAELTSRGDQMVVP